jgi:hypothetical protein
MGRSRVDEAPVCVRGRPQSYSLTSCRCAGLDSKIRQYEYERRRRTRTNDGRYHPNGSWSISAAPRMQPLQKSDCGNGFQARFRVARSGLTVHRQRTMRWRRRRAGRAATGLFDFRTGCAHSGRQTIGCMGCSFRRGRTGRWLWCCRKGTRSQENR